MRQNDRKPWEQFTVCICDKCGEAYEPDREHVCRKKNSYPGAETDKSNINSKSNINRILAFGAFVNGVTGGGYIK